MARKVFRKQPCVCKHGKSIHESVRVNDRYQSPCNHPNCNCKNYEAVKKP
jgi:hypothetical protein